MPPFVRRKPLAQRVLDYLNPQDFWLWLSEEIETRDWDQKNLANYISACLHFVFMVARANTRTSSKGYDDVFGEPRGGPGWFSWLASILVTLMTAGSAFNAAYTFLRKKHYRLFESSVDAAPSTPSAHRVRVDSSPATSSPLRLLSTLLGDSSAESRSHPDPTRDVWEIAVWDPLELCLRLYCLFSPGHVLVYWLFLPVVPLNPRPSVTVVTTIVLQLLLSAQLLSLQTNYSQQIKDTAVIQKEVLNEYDTKYVHPRMINPPSRDVGTQFSSSVPKKNIEVDNEVQTFTPTTILKRTFKTNPNPNYAKYVSPDNPGLISKRETMSPLTIFQTPGQTYDRREVTPLRTTIQNIKQPNFRQSTGGSVSSGTSMGAGVSGSDGGSLGVYSHGNSPLKKTTSLYDINRTRQMTPMNSLQAAAREIAEGMERDQKRSMSPAKRLLQEDERRRQSMQPGFITRGDDPKKQKGYY